MTSNKVLVVLVCGATCLSTAVLAQVDAPGEEDVRRVPQLFGSVGQSIVSFHAEYTLETHPFNESMFPDGNFENAIAENPDTNMGQVKQWIGTLRDTYSQDLSLNVRETLRRLTPSCRVVVSGERCSCGPVCWWPCWWSFVPWRARKEGEPARHNNWRYALPLQSNSPHAGVKSWVAVSSD